MIPAIRPGYAQAGLVEPQGMDIDVHALHQGFLAGAKARGASIVLDATITDLERKAGRWHARTRQGEFVARTVINAAGAWCDEIARMAGAKAIGLVAKRRTAFTLKARSLDPDISFDPDGWPMCIDIDEDFYFKADAGRLLCSPADETPSPPCDAQPEDIDIAIAVERLRAATVLGIDRIEARWAGLRSFVFDGSLVIGPDPEQEGFLWMAALGGYGIQTSPATSRIVAALATGEGFPCEFEALGLSPLDLDPGRIA
uniref:FAD-dependent oxidoreductase domain-containing protein 1 n=1 Tax=Amphimedon queenslandica TaxID=400682 RepID=A0A1X7TJ78_AMPQE